MCNDNNNDLNINQIPSKTDNKRNQKYILGFIFFLFTNFVLKKKWIREFLESLITFSETKWSKNPINHKRLRQTLSRNSKIEITLFFVFCVHRTRKKGRDWISRYWSTTVNFRFKREARSLHTILNFLLSVLCSLIHIEK